MQLNPFSKQRVPYHFSAITIQLWNSMLIIFCVELPAPALDSFHQISVEGTWKITVRKIDQTPEIFKLDINFISFNWFCLFGALSEDVREMSSLQ